MPPPGSLKSGNSLIPGGTGLPSSLSATMNGISFFGTGLIPPNRRTISPKEKRHARTTGIPRSSRYASKDGITRCLAARLIVMKCTIL